MVRRLEAARAWSRVIVTNKEKRVRSLLASGPSSKVRDEVLGVVPAATIPGANSLSLFFHASETAFALKHAALTLTREEWDASENQPATSKAIIARFGTWKKFISVAKKQMKELHEEMERGHEKWSDAVDVLMDNFLDKMEAQGLFASEHTDAGKNDLGDWIWFHLTGVH